MPGSTYSSNLKIELMTTGENSGTWGDVTNTNLGTALEQAIIGYGNPDYTSDANLTITITNSSASQAARCLVLNVTSVFGSLTATRELIVPTSQKQYIVQNNTTGGQSITVKTSAGTGITVPNGRKAHLYVNGTDVIQMFDFVDINGGAIDGTPIGASSASTGAFTTLGATGNVTLGDADTDTITQAASYVTGTQLKSAKTATNTLSLAAYDVDGTAYTNLITLTAGNTPTLALTSTGVGSMDNIAIGATTASTGAFTTLSATGAITSTSSGNSTVTTGIFENTSTGTSAINRFRLNGGTSSAFFEVQGSGFSGTNITNGPTTSALVVWTGSNIPVSIGVNASEIGRFSSTGLAVTGTFSSTLGATIQGLTVGRGAGAVSNNTAVGLTALAANTTGSRNSGFGAYALYVNTTGANNTAIGHASMFTNTTGVENSAVGDSALRLNTTGSNNSAFGTFALYNNTTASYNTAVGYTAGYSNTTGTGNAFFGVSAGYSNTTGNANTAVGGYYSGVSGSALQSNSTGSYNTAVGLGSLYSNTTSSNNVAVGYQAGYSNTTGTFQVAVGDVAMYTNTTGTNNTAVGRGSMYLNTTGSYNTGIGTSALQNNTTASNNTAVGYQAGYNNTATGGTFLGNQAGYYSTTGAYNVYVGNASGANSATSTGAENTAVGTAALNAITSGNYNVAVGRSALLSNTTASNNTAVGYQAAYSNTTGVRNSAFGDSSLRSNTTANNNNAFGYLSLYTNTTGTANAAFGTEALFSNTTASNNTAVGYQAGYSNNTNGGNLYVGYQTALSATGTKNTFLGGFQSGYYVTTGSKNTILGNYDGYAGGSLDIRTASNYIVLSDGDGNPKLQIDNSTGGNIFWLGERIENSSSNNLVVNNANSIRINIDCDNNNPDGESFVIGKNQRSIDNNNKLFEVLETGTVVLPFGQIKFPATQNASSDANTLDDYEEGLWTPAFSSTGATFSYANQFGSYVKIGQMVLAQVYINATASGTTTNDCLLTGLPFTSSTANASFAQYGAGVWSTSTIAVNPLVNANGATTVTLWKQGSVSIQTAADMSGKYLVGTIMYRSNS